nr:hypothetical protein BCU41_05650 [Vibrio lentus]
MVHFISDCTHLTQCPKLLVRINIVLPIKSTYLKTQEADDILTLLALVSANIGFTIVPSSAQFISNTDVEFITLQGEHSTWPVGLIWNGECENPLRDRFVEFVTDQK